MLRKGIGLPQADGQHGGQGASGNCYLQDLCPSLHRYHSLAARGQESNIHFQSLFVLSHVCSSNAIYHVIYRVILLKKYCTWKVGVAFEKHFLDYKFFNL